MRNTLCCALAALVLSVSPQGAGGYEATLVGVAAAHDGDDIRFGDVQVRLIGVAAP
jgi:hypothetical protein